MARKSIGYVKLAWTCDRCDGENPGPRKFCNACGAPQPADVDFHQPTQEIFVTKPEEIAAAQAGADVHCPYCNARNPGNATFCGACGGGLEDAEVREAGKVLGAHKSAAALPITCPSCGTQNSAEAMECAGCGDGLATRRSEPAAKEPGEKTKSGRTPWVMIITAVVACLGIGGLLYALFGRTEEIVATVSSVRWERSLPIEMLGEVEGEDWLDQIPNDGSIEDCQETYRYSQSDPAPNAIEVCGTPYTVDKGSGYGEVVQDCEYEVYDQFCTYTVLDWVVFDTVTASGSDLSPYWPTTTLTTDERFGDGQEEYQVSLESSDETYIYSPDSEQEFIAFTQGSSWILEVNAMGGVVSLSPAE